MLANTYMSLSVEMDNLQKLVRDQVEIPQFSNMYQRLSDLTKLNSELILHQGHLINDRLNSEFKYQREQGRTSFQEAHLLVQGSEAKF